MCKNKNGTAKIQIYAPLIYKFVALISYPCLSSIYPVLLRALEKQIPKATFGFVNCARQPACEGVTKGFFEIHCLCFWHIQMLFKNGHKSWIILILCAFIITSIKSSLKFTQNVFFVTGWGLRNRWSSSKLQCKYLQERFDVKYHCLLYCFDTGL